MNLLPWLPDRPERTEVIHALTQAAFAPYAALARPSGALAESADDVATDLATGGGLIAYDESWSTALGALRWRVDADHLWVKRVAVHPDHQGDGVGAFLMDACRGVAHATARTRIRLGVRHSLDDNRRWYERRGYRRVVDHDDWAEYEVAVEALDFGAERVTLWKYEYPDHLQATFDVDVVEESPAGTWVRVPQFTPSFTEGRIVWIWPEEAVGWLPRDEWWTAWFTPAASTSRSTSARRPGAVPTATSSSPTSASTWWRGATTRRPSSTRTSSPPPATRRRSRGLRGATGGASRRTVAAPRPADPRRRRGRREGR